MKKKILLGSLVSIMLIAGLFVLTGCGNNESGEQNTDSKTAEVKEKSNKQSNEFKIKDVTFKFDKGTTFNDFNYKSDEKLTSDESKQAVYLEYKNNDIYDGRFVFRTGMLFSTENTMEQVIGNYTTESKSINGIEWKKISVDNTTDGKQTTSVIYVTEQNSKIYMVNTMAFKEANIDVDGLSEVFMNGVTLNN